MATSTSSIRKRKREDGVKMPRLRETIDPETGEVYHVETTRQAKRRFQKNAGAQYKPTVGQINAADIWNKQEEKIKRDKQREEKRKKEKAKQEAKDARQRELQQEMLKRGKISVEDTWGKVNASQNRLHRFFGGSVVSKQMPSPTVLSSAATSEQNTNPQIAAGLEGEQGHSISEADDTLQEDLERFFSTSPLSSDSEPSKRPPDASFVNEATLLVDHRKETLSYSGHNSIKRKSSQMSQIMMPPPKRSSVFPSAREQSSEPADYAGRSSTGPQQPDKLLRSPLTEMTDSQLNVRAMEKPDPLSECSKLPIATQVVRDTFSGLCSQDFEDDFADDEKENLSPLQRIEHKPKRSNDEVSAQSPTTRINRNDRDPRNDVTSQGPRAMNESFTSDEFIDEGIDDESLLALAATQQLRREIFATPRHKKANEKVRWNSQSKYGCLSCSQENYEQPPSSPANMKLGESFAMDGLDDDDLLEGLECYENGTASSEDTIVLQCVEGKEVKGASEHAKPPLEKGRRVLPWIKNPISYSFSYDEDDELTPSPLSQLADD